MGEPIEWGGTPGPWRAEADQFGDQDYLTCVVLPSKSGFDGQPIMRAEHNWQEAARGERRISWKEAETNARAAAQIPAMVNLLRRIRSVLVDTDAVFDIEQEPARKFVLKTRIAEVTTILDRIDRKPNA